MPQSERAGERKVGGEDKGKNSWFWPSSFPPLPSSPLLFHKRTIAIAPIGTTRKKNEEERARNPQKKREKPRGWARARRRGRRSAGCCQRGRRCAWRSWCRGPLPSRGTGSRSRGWRLFLRGRGVVCGGGVSESFFNEKQKTKKRRAPPLSQRLFFQKNISYPWRGGRS